MAVAGLTATELLAAIRRRGALPSGDPTFTDANLLLEADTQLAETFVPLVLKMRSDYYLRSEDQTIAAGQAAYPLPTRAMLSTLRKVEWIDSSGLEIEVFPIPVTDLSIYSQQTGVPRDYAIRDDEIVLAPTPNAALGTLRVHYEYRPQSLVTSGFYVVDSTTSTAVTLTASVTWDADSRFDFVKGKAPFSLLGVDADPASTGSGVTLTFPSADIPSRLSAGDYMCLPGQSPVPQLPAELHPTLALAVAAECVSQYSPDEGAILDAKLQRALETWTGTLAPRQRGRQIKQVNRNSAIRRGWTTRRASNREF